MQPVTSTIAVPQPIDEVWAHLDVLANHEAFNDHFLVDWTLSGPPTGVGSHARARAKAGRANWFEIEVVSADAPRVSVEQGRSAGGRRLTQGTYRLDPLPDGGTRIAFTLEWLQPTTADRLTAPIARGVVRRANDRAMRRLAEQLASARA